MIQIILSGGVGSLFIMIIAFVANATALHIEHKPDLHAPRTRVELEGFKESANTRETRSRWEGKGSKLKVRYR